jgi:hypothetical protein
MGIFVIFGGTRAKNRRILDCLVQLLVVWILIRFSTAWLALIGLIRIALVMYRG